MAEPPPPTLLATCGHLLRHVDTYRPLIRDSGVVLQAPKLVGQQFDSAAMAQMLPESDCVIAGDDMIDASAIAAGAAGRLRTIVKWGVGTDNIDKGAAQDAGIPVYNTPGVFSNEVADLALAYVLCLARGVHRMDRGVRDGGWPRFEGTTLDGLTAGIVGLGGIGRAIARRCSAFGMDVIGYDPVAIGDRELALHGTRAMPLEEVFARSDVLILACALTPESRCLVDATAFAQMKRGVTLVNVARGPIVVEADLIEALRTGQVGAAGLDVFETEPLPSSSPLRAFDNCLFGTHSGSSTKEAVTRVNEMTVEIALAALGISPERLARHNRVA